MFKSDSNSLDPQNTQIINTSNSCARNLGHACYANILGHACHHVQHMQDVGPNLFVRNENIPHVMPHVTACAMMSCMHRVAHTRRQAGHPMYTWHARNYLWKCHSCRPNDIQDFANRNVLKRILIAMLNENKDDWNENFRICTEEPIAHLYKQ